MSKGQIKKKIQEDSSSSEDSMSQQNQEREYEFQSENEHDDDESSMNNEDLQKKKQQLLEMQERNIKDQLKSVPFGELVKYKKLKEQVAQANDRQVKKDRSKRQIPDENQKHGKHDSRQIKIMRRPVKNKFKPIFQNTKPKSIDPRFQSYAGNYNSDLAAKTYSFIQDIQKNEVDYLKKQIKNKKLNQHDKDVLLKNYNKVTNDMKRFENQKLERQVKAQYKGKDFVPKKRQFKEQVQRAKLQRLDNRSQDQRLKKKQKKIQKQRTIQRKQNIYHVQKNN